jgi:hypothetical protein
MAYPDRSEGRQTRHSYYPPSDTHQITTYTSNPSSLYFARLAEKAAPSGTIHLHSYEPAIPAPRGGGREAVSVRREVVYERDTVHERDPVKETATQPTTTQGNAEVRERGVIREVAGRGVGAVWKALGGR